ncbi:energy transducer TonB [Oleiharenicola lentus]|jgi:TonB family protein|nr:energy transducer TonB [Oleiharenicola lentus]
MNPKFCLVFLIMGLSAAAVPPPVFESAGVVVTVEPQIPARLRMEGLRDGRVTFAVDVDAEGKLTDWLVLEASHADLIAPCSEAIQRWRFSPARYDGARVPVRVKFTVNLSMTGAVISRTVVDTVGDFFERVAGRPLDYRISRGNEIDRPLEALNRVSPAYASEAQRQGVAGRVTVFFFVDERGQVRLPAVSAETHPYLSGIAVRAMREWKFTPPTREGRPVTVEASQAFVFGGEGK